MYAEKEEKKRSEKKAGASHLASPFSCTGIGYRILNWIKSREKLPILQLGEAGSYNEKCSLFSVRKKLT